MNEQKKQKRKRFDVQAAGCWQGCGGEYYTGTGKCRICGKGSLAHISGRLPAAKSEPDPFPTLDVVSPSQTALIPVDRPCRVRITRCYRKGQQLLDHDNLVGGSKGLRDAICEKILGRSSDAESSGITWEYRQEPGSGTLVEIFEMNE